MAPITMIGGWHQSQLSLLRDSLEPISVTMLAERSDQWYNASRGLLLTGLSDIRRAGTWNEAWRLGFRETWESVTQVIRVLRGLLIGQFSWQNLVGPITIATVAGYEASEGFSQLLIFLTLLSANLAVLNFLPIPALDGGHMVFLIAEGIRGKPVDERLQMLLTILGVAFRGRGRESFSEKACSIWIIVAGKRLPTPVRCILFFRS